MVLSITTSPAVEPFVPTITPPPTVKASVLVLKVKVVFVLGGLFPLLSVVKTGKHSSSEDSSSATVIFVAVVAVLAFPVQEPEDPLAFPVTFPVKAPTKLVDVNSPEFELKVNFNAFVFGARFPVAPVANIGKQVVSDDSSATVISDAAAAPVETEKVVFPKEVSAGDSDAPIIKLLFAFSVPFDTITKVTPPAGHSVELLKSPALVKISLADPEPSVVTL